MMLTILMLMIQVMIGILLLYLWADVRDGKRELQEIRRERMRNSIGGRMSGQYPGFSEENYWREAEEQAAEPEPPKQPALPEERTRVLTLKPGEEEVLREILLEFLN